MKMILQGVAIVIVVLATAACARSGLSDTPEGVLIVVSDVERFWQAWDAADGLEGEARADAFRRLYLEQGTPGLRDFIEARIGDAEKLVRVIDSRPRYYASLRRFNAEVAGSAEPVREAFARFEEIYPDAVFPNVYIVMGRMNSAGTIGRSGLLVGVDMFGRAEGTPLDELDDWASSVLLPIDSLPYVIAHELIHYQQEWSSANPPLLEKVLREGGADFIAELISGRHMNQAIHDWALPREAEIWARFSKVMDEEDHDGWLYGGDRPEGWPADVGYFVGYRIAQAYYAQAEDKRVALKEILASPDVRGLLARSGYAQRFEKISGEFTLRRLAGEEWLGEYCYSEPVEAIRFERPVETDFRRNYWQAVDDDFELRVDEKGVAELWRKDGGEFDCAAVRVRTWTALPVANYYAFSRFSDGGMSVYTGYYMGPVRRHGEWRETALAAKYIGREGERVVARKPDTLVQQFVYFGSQSLVATEAVTAIIDPAVPERIRAAILETIPAVNELLAEHFEFVPADPYMVFMATELDAFDGYSVKGGALPGQIEFNLKGREVVPMLDQDPLHYPKTTAHEVIHLWQNDHWFENLGVDRPWVHEGSAEALAFEVMRMTGIYDDARYAQAWKDVEASCVRHLQAHSIHAGPENGSFDIAYSCGALLNRLAGELLEPRDPGAGILRFWKAMAAAPAEARKGRSEELFFRTLRQLGVDARLVAKMEALLELRGEEAEQAIAGLRQEAGAQVAVRR